MNINLIFFIICILINIVYSILPPSPGPIPSEQITSPPSVILYGNLNENGIESISDKCNIIKKTVPQNFYPLLVLNSTAYFGRTKDFELAIVTNEGLFEMEVQHTLFSNVVLMTSEISYDDSISTNGVFIYMDKFNRLSVYDISKDIVYQTKINYFSLSSKFFYGTTYYDYSTKNYYGSVLTIPDTGSIIQQFFIANLLNNQNKIYSVSELNLEYSIDTIYIAGYNNQAILFGGNQVNQQSYIYLVDPAASKSQLIATKSYDTVMIPGLNSRYLVFSFDNGTTTELLDLEPITFTTFSNTCTQTIFLNALTSSIIPKEVFSQ